MSITDERKGKKIVLLSEQSLELAPLRQKLLASNVAALLIPDAIVKVEETPKLGSGKTHYPALNELARSVTEAAM